MRPAQTAGRMFQDHYPALACAYFVGLGGWLLAQRALPGVWTCGPQIAFARPWKELGFALLGALGIIGMGQLWSRGVRLPGLEALEQLLIFAPILLVPLLRRQAWSSAWLPRERLGTRVLAGLGLSSLALCAYSLLRAGADAPWVLFGRIWRFEHFDELVQVFLEDVAIAILFVRLAAAIGSRWATALVAGLFAAGHIPALLAQGASAGELVALLRDAGLGIAVLLVLQRSRDVLWFACLHYCLDLTQFEAISGAT